MLPVGYRYGWDTAIPAHQECVWYARKPLTPVVSPWFRANRGTDCEAQRLAEKPTLQWINNECFAVGQNGGAAIVEAPYGSDISKKFALSCRTEQDGTYVAKLDQCQHG